MIKTFSPEFLKAKYKITGDTVPEFMQPGYMGSLTATDILFSPVGLKDSLKFLIEECRADLVDLKKLALTLMSFMDVYGTLSGATLRPLMQCMSIYVNTRGGNYEALMAAYRQHVAWSYEGGLQCKVVDYVMSTLTAENDNRQYLHAAFTFSIDYLVESGRAEGISSLKRRVYEFILNQPDTAESYPVC